MNTAQHAEPQKTAKQYGYAPLMSAGQTPKDKDGRLSEQGKPSMSCYCNCGCACYVIPT